MMSYNRIKIDFSRCEPGTLRLEESTLPGIYLLLYTLLASFPLLVGILYVYYSDNLIFFYNKYFLCKNFIFPELSANKTPVNLNKKTENA